MTAMTEAPKDLPTALVYPFGGGDLMAALQLFPEATEITTISLELAGDPRRWRALPCHANRVTRARDGRAVP